MENTKKIGEVLDQIREIDFVQHAAAWSDLDALSNRTIVDEVDADSDSVILKDDHFTVLFTVYVVLQYGSGADLTTISDEFPGKARGHFVEDRPVFEEVSVDTASFYE